MAARLKDAKPASRESKALEDEDKKLAAFSRRAVAPAEAPDLLAYLGYVLNFTTVLGGPAFDFREYCDAQARETVADLPSRVLPAAWKWLQGVVYLAAMSVLVATYTESTLYRYAAFRGDFLSPGFRPAELPWREGALVYGTNVPFDLAKDSYADGYARCAKACENAGRACRGGTTANFYGLFDFPGSAHDGFEFVTPTKAAEPNFWAAPTSFAIVLPKWDVNCLLFAEPRARFEGFLPFVAYAAVTLMIVRVGYYAFWKLSEGAAVLAGFGFRDAKKVADSRKSANFTAAGKPAFADLLWLLSVVGVSLDGVRAVLRALCCSARFEPTLALFGVALPGDAPAGDWEGVSNVNPVTVETRVSMKDVIVHWNCQVQAWLQNYIYLRTPSSLLWGTLPKANKYATMLTSAVWHGFFPGYYLAFATAPFIQESMVATYAAGGKFAQRALGWAPRDARAGGDGCQFPESAAWLPARLLWAALRLVATFLTFAYSLAPFVVLRWNRGIAIWAYCGFIGHLIPLAIAVAAALLLPLVTPRAPSASKQDAAAAGSGGAPGAEGKGRRLSNGGSSTGAGARASK